MRILIKSLRNFSRLNVKCILFFFLNFSLLQSSVPASFKPAPSPEDRQTGSLNYEFINGQWFNGRKFEHAVFYSSGNRFTRKKPGRIDLTVDLKGQYMVPPFGEAHNHNITSEYTLNTETPHYFRDGIFYARMASSIAPKIAFVREKVNHPESLDVVFGSAGITMSGGHPVSLQKRLASSGTIPGLDPDKLEGIAYFTVNSIEELNAKWKNILDSKPDFIKTMLLFSNEKDKTILREGLSPEIYRRIVKLAHKAGLRVLTHIETAADFALAVDAGADEIAHLPGYAFRPALGIEAYKIDKTTARRAARKNVIAGTTCIFSEEFYSKWQEQSREIQIHNLRLLHNSGVRIAIGTDVFKYTSLDEIKYLHKLGVFDNLTLLKLWSEVTPQSIFPDRKIGKLESGYEASFLGLACNPIENFECVEKIGVRFKQGQFIKTAQ